MNSVAYDLALWEICRRTLKSEKLNFIIDDKLEVNIQDLNNKISDLAPTVLLDVRKTKSTNSNEIIIESNEEIIGIISKREPRRLDVIWIQNSPKLFWIDFEMRIIKLVEAGYPGCIGCGGPGSEEIWNEQHNRFLSRQ
ncbi:MAG: hypothetical protein HOJ64_01560 [Euryarchaeota archaeon]|jgi:hypothetical protein|nr:hypothetical protein [Euryarchaeota archaeon]MBT4802667.1 hypothetical protein [Euryarchaeota archaeon]MBT5613544.1 hypothetical protein [Euryarchaeota archaeon]MBT6683906.1 hypothetical protein [Euryarchaeota archaeon]MBT6874561.1 hypothetical protein [Euryarchaeota archaeon]